MNKHSPSVLIKKEMLKIWNFPMKQTKNPNTQFEIQIGEKGKSWKANLWIVAHGGSSLFPSFGELFFFEIVLLRRSVWRWWRFDVKEVFCEREGSYPSGKNTPTSTTTTSSTARRSGSGDQAVAVVEVRWEGSKGSRGSTWGVFLFCLRWMACESFWLFGQGFKLRAIFFLTWRET